MDERFIEHIYGFLAVLERILNKNKVADEDTEEKKHEEWGTISCWPPTGWGIFATQKNGR